MVKNPGSSCINSRFRDFCRYGIDSLKSENRTSGSSYFLPARVFAEFILIPIYTIDYWV